MWVGLAMFALAAMVLAYDRARLLSLIVRLKSIGISWGSLARTQPTRPPPVAVAGGIGAIPVVGSIYMLLSIIFDPTRLVQRLRLTYGPVFTLRIPFHFDIAYFLGEEGYRTVMSMRPGEGKGALEEESAHTSNGRPAGVPSVHSECRAGQRKERSGGQNGNGG